MGSSFFSRSGSLFVFELELPGWGWGECRHGSGGDFGAEERIGLEVYIFSLDSHWVAWHLLIWLRGTREAVGSRSGVEKGHT